MSYRLFLFGVFILVCSETTAGAVSAGGSRDSYSASEFLSSSFSDSAFYTVDSAALVSVLEQGSHLEIDDFPGGDGERVSLDLKASHSPIDATTEFWVGTANGAISVRPPSFFVFRGKVLGEPNSRIFLTAFAGKLLVSISRASGETYVFGPAKNSEARGAHIFMREADLLSFGELHPMNCITEDIAQPVTPRPVSELLKQYRSSIPANMPHSQLLELDVAVEADSCFYHAAGNDMNTVLGYIASLFAMSSSIYEDEVNITWHLSWVKVWPSGDPYNVQGNAYGLEDTVPKYWRAHYADVPRDCAHVLTSIGYGGGGFGYYSMCDPQNSYSMSSPQTGHQYPTFAFTYDAYIVAHEIGHNFSLVHSHQCYWDPPLDTCYTKDDTTYGLQLGDACESRPITPRRSSGTIMSYCANANYVLAGRDISQFKLAMTFSKKVDSVLRVNAELDTCLTPPAQPTVILTSPRGSETFSGDTNVFITWSYANVDSISLEYSSDGGTMWNGIVKGIPASSGSYVWNVPNVATKKMLVRAFDVGDVLVADTSLLVFTVVPVASVSNAGSDEHFSISPNPAQQELWLSGIPSGHAIMYDIIDANGSVILYGCVQPDAKNVAHFPVDPLPSGTYYLRLTSPVSRIFSFVHIK